MESLDTAARFMEDLLDFGEEELEEADNDSEKTNNSLPSSSPFSLLRPRKAVSEYVVEEELEWISNKDAFPMVESFVDIIPNHRNISTVTATANHHSPVSVLENSCGSSTLSHGSSSSHRGGSAIVSLPSNLRVPVKARSKQQRKRRRDMDGEQWHSWASSSSSSQEKPSSKTNNSSRPSSKPSSTIGRKCLHCQAEKTPQWRAGPYGPKTLCNACGVRYKSGRLVPEYRPASSPTFSTDLHSNSHRKIIEMRRQKPGVMGSSLSPSPGPDPGSEAKPKEEIG